MSNPYEDPFEDPNSNAHQNPLSAGQEDENGAWGGGAGAWRGARNQYDAGSPSPPPQQMGMMGQSLNDERSQLAEERRMLAEKERQLEARELELKRWEAELRRNGGRVQQAKNWPKCYPITYHDIKAEVPMEHQRLVTQGYWIWLALLITLTFQFLVVFGTLIEDGNLEAFLFAFIYLSLGAPCGWILWYRRIYTGAANDKARHYLAFFTIFFLHIVFCAWSALAPDVFTGGDMAHTGIISSTEAFDKSAILGILYLVGFAMWTALTVVSIIYMGMVYRSWRNMDGPAKARNAAAATATQAAANNTAAAGISSPGRGPGRI